MLRWLPFIGKAVHALMVARLEADRFRLEQRVEELRSEVAYWRTRAEKLNDQLLARAGAISEPTMHDRKPPANANPGGVFAGMAVNEIETGKQ